MTQKMNKILEYVKKIINKNINVLLFLAFLNSITFCIDRYYFIERKGIFVTLTKVIYKDLTIFYFFVGVAILLELVLKRYSSIIINIFSIISCVLFLVDCELLFNFRTIINHQTVQVLFESNVNEGTEFVKQYFNITVVIIILFIFILYFFTKRIKIILKNRWVVLIFLLISISQLLIYKPILRMIPISRLIDSSINSYGNVKIYKEVAGKIRENVNIIHNESHIKNIVLVIGESTTRNHMNLYGYSKNNTPFLKELSKKSNMYVYSDVISPHSHTLAVLREALTFFDDRKNGDWYDYNNIVDIMKKAGYKTYWFSNQESMGKYGNLAAALGNRSDVVLFNEKRDTSETRNRFDGEILNKSKNLIEFSNKNFIVYHLLGSHYLYKYRYPNEFNVFSSDDYSEKIDDIKRQYRAEYDNTILYNDFVINEIIDFYKDKEAIIIYFSDHGEEVYDFRDFVGHTETNLSRYMVEIPFLIYVSDKFIENYPDKVEKIKESVSRPYMTDDVIHTILDISDIETTEYDPTRSVINDKYISRDRMLHGKSYDNYWKTLN